MKLFERVITARFDRRIGCAGCHDRLVSSAIAVRSLNMDEFGALAKTREGSRSG